MSRRRAIGYVRVSTEGQAERGLGLRIQEHAIRNHARTNDLRLGTIYRDEGVSGTLHDRPGLSQALAALNGPVIMALVVYRLDRLARDVVLQEALIQGLTRKGVDVVSVAEPAIAGGDPTRKLVRQLLGAVSEYEGALIALRMRSGREAKRRAGGYAGGRPPYGYKALGRALVPDPEEAAVTVLARRLHRRGLSLRLIAARLEEEGHRPRTAERWHPAQVARLLGATY